MIKISLKVIPRGSINNIQALVQIMAWRRSGIKPLSEAMLVSLLTHKCVILCQWVNTPQRLLHWPWCTLRTQVQSLVATIPLLHSSQSYSFNLQFPIHFYIYFSPRNNFDMIHLISLIALCWVLSFRSHWSDCILLWIFTEKLSHSSCVSISSG